MSIPLTVFHDFPRLLREFLVDFPEGIAFCMDDPAAAKVTVAETQKSIRTIFR